MGFKFTALATVQGGIEMWEGGRAVREEKIYCTGHWKLAAILLYNTLKSPVGANVLKTSYRPLIDTALYVMLLMRANPLLGKVGGCWALEISPFWAPNGTMPFHRALKSLYLLCL